MITKKIAIVGKPKSTESITLFLKQKVNHQLVRYKSEFITTKVIKKEQFDLLL